MIVGAAYVAIAVLAGLSELFNLSTYIVATFGSPFFLRELNCQTGVSRW
jgi:hypothetical protein